MTVLTSQKTAQQLLLALVSEPIDGPRVTSLLLNNPDWHELYYRACRHEVLPLVYRGLGAFSAQVPAEILAQYQNLHANNLLRNLQLHNELKRLVKLLLKSGIPVIPYKGPLLAEAAYGDLALRSFKDLDLLIPTNCGWQAWQILQNEGYSLGFDLTRERWPSLLKTINHLCLYAPDKNWAVELHWQPFHPMYRLPFDLSHHWLQLQTATAATEGRLEKEEELVLLCVHGTKHYWESLKWVADVQRFVLSHNALDWDRTLGVAVDAHAQRSLLLGLELAGRFGPLPLPASISDKSRSDQVIKLLADDVWMQLFPDKGQPRRVYREYLFLLRSRERFVDRWLQILGWLFCPRQADWQLFPLGSYCYALFYIERPVRMLWKWVFAPAFAKLTRLIKCR